MVDPIMQDFQVRLKRIDRIHRQGGGFEAAGTLGMSYYNSLKQQRSRNTWLMPVVLVLSTVVFIKGAVLANIGETTYQERIVALQAGDAADRIGAYVLQADPLTRYLAGMLQNIMH